MQDKDPGLYEKYKTAAGKLAEHIYRRGFSFPTEGGFGFEGTGDVKIRIAPRFPDREDVKTARYAWLRAAETILNDL